MLFRSAEILSDTMNVRIFGTAANVEAVTGAHISVTADLSDYSAASGTYTIPAAVTVAIGDVGIIGEYQVQVTIREKDAEEPPEPQPPQEEEPTETIP